MDKIPRTIFRTKDEEAVKTARQYINERLSIGKEEIHLEYKKTLEDVELISSLDNGLIQEVARLGFQLEPISLEQIHLLTPEAYDQLFPGRGAQATAVGLSRAVYVDVDKIPPGSLPSVLVHEMLHLHSIEAVRLSDAEAQLVKTGFQSQYGDSAQFRGLNEATTEKFAEDIVRQLSLEDKEYVGVDGYKPLEKHYVDILNLIIEKIAKTKEEDLATVWNRFKASLFTGEMMHLRDVEDVFGGGSLRILSALGSDETQPPEYYLPLFIKYFSTNDDAVKRELTTKILRAAEQAKHLHE